MDAIHFKSHSASLTGHVPLLFVKVQKQLRLLPLSGLQKLLTAMFGEDSSSVEGSSARKHPRGKHLWPCAPPGGFALTLEIGSILVAMDTQMPGALSSS